MPVQIMLTAAHYRRRDQTESASAAGAMLVLSLDAPSDAIAGQIIVRECVRRRTPVPVVTYRPPPLRKSGFSQTGRRACGRARTQGHTSIESTGDLRGCRLPIGWHALIDTAVLKSTPRFPSAPPLAPGPCPPGRARVIAYRDLLSEAREARSPATRRPPPLARHTARAL